MAKDIKCILVDVDNVLISEIEEVDAEKAETPKGKRNLKDEKRRIVRELKK